MICIFSLFVPLPLSPSSLFPPLSLHSSPSLSLFTFPSPPSLFSLPLSMSPLLPLLFSLHTYRQTAQCKLQVELLKCVGVLSLKLQVSTADLEQLAHACLPYLGNDQPDSLQEACQTCFRHLINLDPDAMWLLLEQSRSEGNVTTPPSSLLKPYKLPVCLERDKYQNNVSVLLDGTNITWY